MLLFLQVSISVTESINKRFLLGDLLMINSKVFKPQDLSCQDIRLVNLNKNDSFDNKSKNLIILKNLLKKYWKEYIYILPSNKAYEKLNNTYGEHISHKKANNKYKIMYEKGNLNLKKYLVNRQIKVSYVHSMNRLDDKSCVKYTYNKYLKRFLKQFYTLFFYKKHNIKLNNQVVEILETQKFPVFIVMNGLQEIVVGQPEHRLHTFNNSIVTSIKNSFFKKILKYNFQLPLKEIYVFVNPLDGLEYCNYLRTLYPSSVKELQLKIFVGTLRDFYKNNKVFSEEVQFRLLPDLKEVGKLVKEYQYKSNINFYYQQSYGTNYFQGQPIYFINPVKCNYFDEQNKIMTKRYFPNSLTLSEKESSYIFTTYEQAILIWKKYKKNFSNYILPTRPKLTVYNLESFLNKYSTKQIISNRVHNTFQLIPGNETYEYLQKIQQTKNPRSLVKTDLDFPVFSQIKVFLKRVLWGMLKWYPPTY